jgi:hypothetical protein
LDLRQPYDGNSEDPGGGISSGRKQSVLGWKGPVLKMAVVLRLHLVNAGVNVDHHIRLRRPSLAMRSRSFSQRSLS